MAVVLGKSLTSSQDCDKGTCIEDSTNATALRSETEVAGIVYGPAAA